MRSANSRAAVRATPRIPLLWVVLVLLLVVNGVLQLI